MAVPGTSSSLAFKRLGKKPQWGNYQERKSVQEHD